MTSKAAIFKTFFSRIRISAQRLIRRCPRRIRILSGPLLGGFIGLIGGIPGFFIGLLLGGLLGRLFVRSVEDRRILDYFESPGLQEFNEGENGMAAWCALAVLVCSKNYQEPSANKASGGADAFALPSQYPVSEKIIRQVVLGSSRMFTGPLADPFLMEHFSRMALANINRLNSDLLAESLAARRIAKGDTGSLCRSLCSLAEKEKAHTLARQICITLDPSQADETTRNNKDTGIAKEPPKDPWKVMGLPPGTPQKEVKTHFRRLAKQFHPDELEVLDKKQREAAAKAFIAIKEAYREIAGME